MMLGVQFWTSPHVETFEPHHIPCRHILCAIDLVKRSDTILQWAAAFSEAVGATVRIVHVVPTEELWARPLSGSKLVDALKEEGHERIANLQRQLGFELPVCVTFGRPCDVIHDEATRHHADLIVIGRGRIHENLGRLRTHAYNIIRQAPCPVISV